MIRHGETVMNALRQMSGGTVDTPLNQEGRRQAYEAAQIMAALTPGQRPTLIIHSDMSRTRETLDILNADLKIPAIGDNELREHDFGEWQGKSWEETLPLLHSGAKPAGGESRAEFATRIRATLTRHLTDHLSERLMFVSHGGVFHSFSFMHGRDKRVFIPNATLHRFEPEPLHGAMPWRVTLYEWKNAVREIPAPFCPSQPDAAKA